MTNRFGRTAALFAICGPVIICALTGCRASKSPDLVAEFDAARRNGVVVVDGRRAVNESGGQSSVEPLWVANAMPGGDAPRAPHELGLTGSPRVAVIFVHGYEVTPAEALEESKALSQDIREANEHLRQQLPVLPETNALALLAFLWKGDFGEGLFSRAQHAAENTGHVFADFLGAVARQAPGARIVVLTHSLGAEVVLEALRGMQEAHERAAVDNLILVQGAVPAHSVYQWTVKYQQIPSGPSEQMKPEQVDQCTGRYAGAIRMARQFVYTFSANDQVLANEWDLGPFRVNEFLLPQTQPCELPVLIGSGGMVLRVQALGSPFDTGDRTEMLPPPKIFEPPAEGAKKLAPSPIQVLPPAMVFHYNNFKIDHPNVERLDIASAEDDAPYTPFHHGGHSVLFQAAGRQVVEELWRLAAANWQ
jgi:pimeloyl-ACP methyl ester carboxylesterase